MLDHDEVDVAPVEPDATNARPIERFPERTRRRTALRAALVRVLDVDDGHLVDLRLRLQTATFVRVGRRVDVLLVVVVVVVVEGRSVEVAVPERRLAGAVAAAEAAFSVTSLVVPRPVIHVDVAVRLRHVVRVFVAAVSLQTNRHTRHTL